VLLGLVVGVAWATGAASADTFKVTTERDRAGQCDSNCALREAVIAANDLSGDDRIKLSRGRFELTIGGPGEDSAEAGDLDVRDAAGELVIAGAGMGKTKVDANRIDRVFNTIGFPGVSLVLSDLTVTGGKAMQSYDGAGLMIEAGTLLKLRRVRVTRNRIAADTSLDGAGMFIADATAIVRRSAISGNVNPTGDGGGIENRGDLQLYSTSVANNDALRGDGAGISMNSAESLWMIGSTVSGNQAGGPEMGGDGGGIYAPSSATNSTVSNSTVSGNRARGSSSQGGGFYVAGQLNLSHMTVAANDSGNDQGGGIFATGAGDVNLLNALIARNDGAAGDENCGGAESAFLSLGNNLENRDTCGLSAPDDVPDATPRLASLADNGGPTRTHALRADSDAINAGDAICPATDQRGVPRPQGPACDIGAFERRK
jgi:CSLREA domain-containing protein